MNGDAILGCVLAACVLATMVVLVLVSRNTIHRIARKGGGSAREILKDAKSDG